jgi:uncharacterized protein (DUF2252 family)
MSPTVHANSFPSLEARLASGKRLRENSPRSSHTAWQPRADLAHRIALLLRTDRGRLPALLPIRYARMRESPFAFFRGAAALMAADLASTPRTGIRVQACGDCHVANFGGFGTPERRLVFDINDFDETLPAPWEWDVKRLAASIVLAMRESGLADRHCAAAARAAVESYRRHMREYAEMPALEVWYSEMSAALFIDRAATPKSREHWQRLEAKAAGNTSSREFPKIAAFRHGRPRIVDRPPLIYHAPDFARAGKRVVQMLRRYRATLPEERRVVLDRYSLVDVARKVVGIGSVGTRCAVALLMAAPHDPLILQFKEARHSVLEPYAGKSCYANQGERVVTGQRMLQSASDVFLGWTRSDDGHDFYIRQLRDMRMKIDVAHISKHDWFEYVHLCGWTLARAHARGGVFPPSRAESPGGRSVSEGGRGTDPALIAGYLGKSSSFANAIADFALAYADQTSRDHAAFRRASRQAR